MEFMLTECGCDCQCGARRRFVSYNMHFTAKKLPLSGLNEPILHASIKSTYYTRLTRQLRRALFRTLRGVGSVANGPPVPSGLRAEKAN